VRSLWDDGSATLGKGTDDPDAETSADEKDSDEDTLVDTNSSDEKPVAGPAGLRNNPPVGRTASIVLQPSRQRPPSPLGQSTITLPAVHLIPAPDSPDVDETHQRSTAMFPSVESPTSPTSNLALPSSRNTSPSPVVASSSTTQAAPKTPFHLPKTLVLDLDETLIHSTTRPLFPSDNSNGMLSLGFGRKGKTGHMVEVVMGGKSTLYHVYKRPFVDYFLRKVSGWYTLVIFTASMREYADPVIDWLDAGHGILARRFFRESCTQLPNGTYTKDLSVVEADLSRVCLVDNSPISYNINQANGIPIEGWTHDPADEALLDLLPVLDSLRFTSDVRHVLGLRGF